MGFLPDVMVHACSVPRVRSLSLPPPRFPPRTGPPCLDVAVPVGVVCNRVSWPEQLLWPGDPLRVTYHFDLCYFSECVSSCARQSLPKASLTSVPRNRSVLLALESQ